MSDATGKGSSCLAVVENKNQRPGGCIGVFFHLFDWNRSLTNKRLFKKLPPPAARAKQASSKKFKGSEKMANSKLHLIANENNGGFPSSKKSVNRATEVEQKPEVRVPGLVARLMGLESIPASRRDQSKKSSFSSGDVENESLDDHSRDFELGVGSAKHEARPQKLQKTGTDEKRTMTRFGTEALQIKSVLSQVRKYNHHHHHTKLVSPLKSPRVPSGKSASRCSRLIGAATKILEPGLQATSRGKHCLTSSTSNNDIVTEMVGARPDDVLNQHGYDAIKAYPLSRQNSCKNCGNLLEIVDCRPEGPTFSDVFTASHLGLAQKERSLTPSHENDVVLLRSQEKIITLVDEDGRNNVQAFNESSTRRMPEPAKRDSSRQLFGAQEDDEASFAFKLKTETQEQALSGEKVSSECRISISNIQEKRLLSSAASTVSGAKDFVALNRRSLSSRSRIRSPTKVDSCKFDLERKPFNKHDDSFERKRSTSSVSPVEAINSGNLVTVKQKNASSGARGGKRRSFDASFRNNCTVKSIQDGQLKFDKINDNKVNETIPFTFSSPSKTKIVIPVAKEERKKTNKVKTDFQRPLPLTVDALGAILEQKLKELSCQENENSSRKSTATILRELISALNLENPTCSDDHAFSDKYEAGHVRLLGTSCKGDHLSPGSVLEASFSSSSLDEGSVFGFRSDDQLEQLEHDAEASFDKGNIGSELVNQIHRILQNLKSSGIILTESNLIHMKEVIFNAELVLGNATEHSEDGMPQLLISCFLLDELDTMASDAMWRDFSGESKDKCQVKGFLFDCVIEYLESNCCQHYYNSSVFKAWTKQPLLMKAKMLVQEVKSEVKKWARIGSMLPDQIIEWEMSHSLGKWTDFTFEAFEIGIDIGGMLLQILVDEIVEDLRDS